MDYESERSRKLRCWDGPTIVTGFVKQWTNSEPVPNFEPDNSYCDALIGVGFNKCSDEVRNYWRSSMKSVYKGENGRRKIRQAGINLAERGSLHLRLSDIRCPVLWLHVGLSSYILKPLLTCTRRALKTLCSPQQMLQKRFGFLHSLLMLA